MLILEPHRFYQLHDDVLILWQPTSQDSRPRPGLCCQVRLCQQPGCSCAVAQLDAWPIDARAQAVESTGGRLRLLYPSDARGDLPSTDSAQRSGAPSTDSAQRSGAPSTDSAQRSGAPSIDGPPLRLSLNYETGALTQLDPAAPLPSDWPIDLIEGCLDGLLLDSLHAAWIRQNDLPTRSFRTAIGSSWEPGSLLSWTLAFPDARPDLYVLDGQTYLTDTMYCVKPDCPCQQVQFMFYLFEPPADSCFMGSVLMDLRPAQLLGLDPHHLGVDRVQHLVIAFLKRHERSGTLLARREILRDIGATLLRESSRPAVSAPVRSSPRVGRNQPCPCGSGQKFKRCCAVHPAP